MEKTKQYVTPYDFEGRLPLAQAIPLGLQRGDLLPLLPAICSLAGQGLQNGLTVLGLGNFPQKAFPLRFHVGEAGQLLFPAFQQAGLDLLVVLLPGLCLLPAVDLLVKGGQSGFFSGQFLIADCAAIGNCCQSVPYFFLKISAL